MIKKDLDELPALECDEEEITEGNVIKMLTANKSLTRFTLLLAQKKNWMPLLQMKNLNQKNSVFILSR